MDLIHKRKKYTIFKMVNGNCVKIGVSRSKRAILSKYPKAYKLYGGKGRGYFGHRKEHRLAALKGKPAYTVVAGTYGKRFRTKSLVKARKHAKKYGGFVQYV